MIGDERNYNYRLALQLYVGALLALQIFKVSLPMSIPQTFVPIISIASKETRTWHSKEVVGHLLREDRNLETYFNSSSSVA